MGMGLTRGRGRGRGRSQLALGNGQAALGNGQTALGNGNVAALGHAQQLALQDRGQSSTLSGKVWAHAQGTFASNY